MHPNNVWDEVEGAEAPPKEKALAKRERTRQVKAQIIQSILENDPKLNAAFDKKATSSIMTEQPAHFTNRTRRNGRPNGGKVIFDHARIDALPAIACTTDVAKILNVRRTSIQQWCRSKKRPLPFVRRDRQMILRKDVLVKWLIATGRYKPKADEK